MAGKKYVRWLYSELPGLVDRGLLEDKHAAALRQHYGKVDAAGGKNLSLVVFSIIGSLLIGAGVITLFAHNWSELTRPARTFLAIAPLLAAQLAGFMVLARNKGVAMREGVSTFISLLFAGAVAIVGQTYHIGGDLGGFLLTCSVCIIPLSFIFDAAMPAVLYMAAVTGWVGYQRANDGNVYFFWLLFLPVLARFFMMALRGRYAGRTVLLGWIMAICLPIATGLIQRYNIGGSWIVMFTSVFGLMYLVAGRWFYAAESMWASPFRAIGSAGIMILAFMLTYDFAWDDVNYLYRWNNFDSVNAFMFLLPLSIAAALTVPLVRERRYLEAATGALPVLVALSFFLLIWVRFEGLAMLFFNFYILVLSIARIAAGLKKDSIAKLNGGMMMLGLLIILRFIDADIGFLVKGIVFILLGAGFLAANLVVLRRRKGEVAK